MNHNFTIEQLVTMPINEAMRNSKSMPTPYARNLPRLERGEARERRVVEKEAKGGQMRADLSIGSAVFLSLCLCNSPHGKVTGFHKLKKSQGI